MSNSLVLRKRTDPKRSENSARAAQYVRMSTDYQRYSIQNQAAAIAAFAQQSNLTIVRTYVDEGRSGLRIRGRAGLLQLIDDVNSGQADFGHILVYDVSRWGRFLDVDESAHYEFVCKQKGIKVTYCAEQFDNDGSLLSSIVKNTSASWRRSIAGSFPSRFMPGSVGLLVLVIAWVDRSDSGCVGNWSTRRNVRRGRWQKASESLCSLIVSGFV